MLDTVPTFLSAKTEDPPPRLGEHDIHIWRVDLPDAKLATADDLGILSDDERARSDRFRFASDRQNFIVGRAALRHILSRYTGHAAAGIRFDYGAFGKPALAADRSGSAAVNRKKISFNCSHSGGVFICAIGRQASIGVDIEKIRPIENIFALAEAHFSPTEIAALRKVAPAQRTGAFFNCWTRKEAYIKSTGAGMSARLDSFSVSFVPGEPTRLLACADQPDHLDIYAMRPLATEPGYVGAIAAEGPIREAVYWRYATSTCVQGSPA